METTYTHEAATRRSRANRGRRASGRGHARGGVALAPKERRRLVQLCVCALLFAVVFFGRGVLPEKLDAVRAQLLTMIHSDTDFRAAFAGLGQSVSSGEPVAETLGGLWGDIFAWETRTPLDPYNTQNLPTYQAERVFLSSDAGIEEVLAHRFGLGEQQQEETGQQYPIAPEIKPELTPTPAPVPSDTLPAQPQPVYTGPAMPEGATMNDVALGLTQTATPVMAALSSDYGWRVHPIDGSEKFHSGVDLAGEYGGAIGAFSDGTVDYIGESPAYGQYLQIKHSNGVTSFYAHCSKLCVQPGQTVEAGEKVAEVGDTGNVTGTHLHFELKQNGKFLNPLYYIQTLGQ